MSLPLTIRCPHDGAFCHHHCTEDSPPLCWRKKAGCALSSPWKHFPLPTDAPIDDAKLIELRENFLRAFPKAREIIDAIRAQAREDDPMHVKKSDPPAPPPACPPARWPEGGPWPTVKLKPGDIIEGLRDFKGFKLRVESVDETAFAGTRETSSHAAVAEAQAVLSEPIRPGDSERRAMAERVLSQQPMCRSMEWLGSWVLRGYARVIPGADEPFEERVTPWTPTKKRSHEFSDG